MHMIWMDYWLVKEMHVLNNNQAAIQNKYNYGYIALHLQQSKTENILKLVKEGGLWPTEWMLILDRRPKVDSHPLALNYKISGLAVCKGKQYGKKILL